MPKVTSKKNLTPEIVKSIEAAAKQYNNVGYNKAALALREAGGNDAKNSCYQAVKAVIDLYRDDKLRLSRYPFAQTALAINGRL